MYMEKKWILMHPYVQKNLTFEMVHEIDLKGSSYYSHHCGYLTPSGTLLKCEPYHHIDLLTSLCRYGGTYYDMYESFKDVMDENNIDFKLSILNIYELFFMVELEWVKIEAYIKPGQTAMLPEEFEYYWKAVRIYPLTPEQQDFLFPK